MNKFLIVLVLIALSSAVRTALKNWKAVDSNNPTAKKNLDVINKSIIKALSLPAELKLIKAEHHTNFYRITYQSTTTKK